MYKHINIIIFSLFCFFLIEGKSQSAIDTIKSSLQLPPQLFGKLDSRNSFINNGRAKVIGVKTGLNFGNQFQIGLGYNQLSQPANYFDKQIFYLNTQNENDSAMAILKLYYISIHIEYFYYKNQHWQLSIPLQIGLGKTYYQYNLLNEKKEIEKTIFFIYEPAISIEYKFVKWIGVGADIGFRFLITGQKQLNQKFNSPTYAFKFLIYYNEIYKSIRNIIVTGT